MAELAKASLETWEMMILLLASTNQVAHRQLDSLCSLKAKGTFFKEGRGGLSFPWGAQAICSSCWGCPGDKVGLLSLLFLPQCGVNLEDVEACSWGPSSGPFIFGSLLELVG